MSTPTPQTVTLKVYPRAKTGKSAAFRTRQQNLIPGVVYGPKVKTPFNVAFLSNELLSTHRSAGKTGLVTLEVMDGAPKELSGVKVLMKEIQQHPFKPHLIHADLHQINLTKKIRVTVPVNFVGKAIGIAEGGILNVITREVEIRCFADKIPNHVDIDVTEVGIGDSLHIEDAEKQLKDLGLEFIYDVSFTLVACTETREEVVVAAVVDPAAAVAGAVPGAPAAAAGAPGAAGAGAALGAAAPAAGAAAAKGAPAAAPKGKDKK